MDSLSYPTLEVSLPTASPDSLSEHTASQTHAISAVEPERAKRNNPALSLHLHRVGTRNVSRLVLSSLGVDPPRRRVTHLEGAHGLGLMIAADLSINDRFAELCFWLFLVNSTAVQQNWFRSVYFKIWAVGSSVAVLAMPLVTILTRKNVYKVSE